MAERHPKPRLTPQEISRLLPRQGKIQSEFPPGRTSEGQYQLDYVSRDRMASPGFWRRNHRVLLFFIGFTVGVGLTVVILYSAPGPKNRDDYFAGYKWILWGLVVELGVGIIFACFRRSRTFGAGILIWTALVWLILFSRCGGAVFFFFRDI